MTIASDITTTGFEDAWRAWHAEHEAERASAHGFLAITALHWLTAEPTRYDGLPGAWSTSADGPVVLLSDGESLEVDGRTVTGEVAFGPIPERGGLVAISGETVIEIAKRGGSDLLRPRHPQHPTRTGYAGTPSYEPDPHWAVPGRFTPFDEPQDVTVGSVAEGLEHVYSSPGAVEFEHDGATHRLTAFNGPTPGSLFVLFTDATSGVTTYPANRSLAIAAPDAEGRVVLDFTRAVNLPCAYTEFATCPLPPAGNRLPFPVDAGERLPRKGGLR
ncbi:DUF1684 domain-containing protein [Leifsonia sp. 22587]|uniref:DUF1684 domain-containing protein n=1 Tax=Leifsonia sp. 22587 TaxID=3453946 RepID=UPI003F842A60